MVKNMVSIALLGIIYLSFVCLGLPDSLLGAAWPSMYEGLNVPLHFAGYISMIIAGGRVISGILCERIARRFGTGFVTSIGIFIIAAALFGYSFSSSFVLLCFWTAVLGLGAGFVDVVLNNYVALHYKAKHMSWLHCFWGIGASIGPMIMSFYLMNKNSWSLGYRTVAIIQCCLMVLLFLTLSLWEKNKSNIKIENKKHEAIPYKELFKIAGVKPILAVFYLYCSLQVITVLWGSSFLVMEKNILPETAASWISLYFIGMTIGRFLSGFLTIKLNNRKMIRLGFIIIACGILALLLPFGELLLMPAFFVIGLGCAPVYPCLLHETPGNFGSEKSQAIIGIQMASGYIGLLLMPSIFGKLASFLSFSIFPASIGILLLVVILIFEAANKKIDSGKI